MADLEETLWYTIPGFIILFTILLISNPENSIVYIFQINIIFQAIFLITFSTLWHIIYRLFYHYIFYGKRREVLYFKTTLVNHYNSRNNADRNIIKQLIHIKKITDLDNVFVLEKIYNFFIFSNKNFERQVHHLKQRKFH